MPQSQSHLWKLGSSLWLLMPAALFGASLALFLYGSWPPDLSPIGDEQMLVITGAIALLVTAGYFVLVRWTWPRLRGLVSRQRYDLILVSVPIAAFLLYGGTSGWTSPPHYLDFLLPDHTLKLSVSPPDSAGGTALVWFNTSLGDVSYSTITQQGWKRIDDQLVVEDPAENSLTWRGEIGDRVQIVLRGSTPGLQADLTWDGETQTIALSRDKTAYTRSFAVPFYSSDGAIMALGFVALYAIVLALCTFLWLNRTTWLPGILRSVEAPSAGFISLDVFLVSAGLVLAALLRVFNLGSLFPAVDEYYHLIAAKQIVEGAALDAVYPRGLWIVTLPVAAALRVFGYQLWAARLVGVVFNVLAIIPLYMLTRKINRPVAALACLLYATSPWIITFARVAREYAYYPFYFYWIIYAMVLFAAAIPQGFVLAGQWKSLLSPKILLLAALLALPPIFALKTDWLSTFRTILIAYLVLGLFILLRFDWRARTNWPMLALIGIIVIIAGRSWYLEQQGKLFLLPHINLVPIEYFLPNPQQQWYLDRAGMLVVLGILSAIAVALLARRLNFVPLFILTLFAGYLLVFAFFSKSFFHTRHLLSTDLWYVIVVALGLFLVWRVLALLLPWLRRPGQIALVGILGLATLNFGQIILPTVWTNPDMPISEDYMHDMTQVQAYMLANIRQGDVLVSTVYGQYTLWEGKPVFAGQLHITSQTPIPDILAFAAEYPSGWIVVDDIRYKLASLSVRDLAGHEDIQYVGEFGDEHVWRWDRNTALAGLEISAEGVR